MDFIEEIEGTADDREYFSSLWTMNKEGLEAERRKWENKGATGQDRQRVFQGYLNAVNEALALWTNSTDGLYRGYLDYIRAMDNQALTEEAEKQQKLAHFYYRQPHMAHHWKSKLAREELAGRQQS